MWGAWIEIPSAVRMGVLSKSHPVWGAWIEIMADWSAKKSAMVAPRVGCVD